MIQVTGHIFPTTKPAPLRTRVSGSEWSNSGRGPISLLNLVLMVLFLFLFGVFLDGLCTAYQCSHEQPIPKVTSKTIPHGVILKVIRFPRS